MGRIPKVMAIDAGGTMIDDLVIDENGEFVVGKAQTTPENESIGFLNSLQDALGYWDMQVDQALPSVVSGIYSGTAMLNRLLSRKGSRVGLLITAGMEDALLLERGVQTHLGFSYSDKLHVATHYHNPALIPSELIRPVFERTDLFGDTAIVLNREAVRVAVAELLELGVQSLCVCLLHSYRNPANEMSVREIALEVMQEKNRSIPVFLSSERYPMRGDLGRLNTLLIDAYAAEPSRGQVEQIQSVIDKRGARFELRVMASHGGTISTGAKELARTLTSGPIGGLVGGRYLADTLGYKNVVCTDIGGTSFDMGLITEGEYAIEQNPEIARFILSIPQVQINTIGAGTGSYVRINPTSNRIEIGPDSAGARIGTCFEQGKVTTPTVTDCHVVLGYIDPHYFLGGEVTLRAERARKALYKHVAKPLGLTVEDAAAGVIEILEENLRNQLLASIVGKGYSPVSYVLLNYGGGGPLHVAGLSRDLGFEDVLVPTWAAGFSAFGCSTADFEYRCDISIDLPLQPDVTQEEKSGIVDLINGQAMFLQGKVTEEFIHNDISSDQISFSLYVRMQYLGQLNDLEVRSPTALLEGVCDLDRLIKDFEDLYSKLYALAAKAPELGYLLTTVVVSGRVDVEKPRLAKRALDEQDPLPTARKGVRDVYWNRRFCQAALFEMGQLRPGNVIRGLAVIEAPSTTFFIPPDREVYLDQHLIFHLRDNLEGRA